MTNMPPPSGAKASLRKPHAIDPARIIQESVRIELVET
jgi:hypothetical protein